MAFRDPLTALLGSFGSSASQVGAKAVWRTRAEPDPPPRPHRGPYQIEVAPELQRVVRGLLNSAAPALARSFNTHLGPVARNAFEGVPVRTGRTKASITLAYSPTDGGDGYSGEVAVSSPYAADITEKGSRRRVFNDLLIRPFGLAASRMGDDVLDDIVRGRN